MSIRVHKAIGYGTDTFEPTDTFRERFKALRETNYTDWVVWCLENLKAIEALAEGGPRSLIPMFHFSLRDSVSKGKLPMHPCVVWGDYDSQDEKKLLLIPPQHTEKGGSYECWFRRDDAIDYAEETFAYQQMGRWVNLDHGLYPNDKGKPPLVIGALLLYLGVPELWGKLQETLHVYWS